MNEPKNPGELAGASQEANKDLPPEPREVFPVKFEKDYLDFRPVAADLAEQTEAMAPKSSSAPVSVEPLKLPTGLEDVFAEDLANPARTNVEKDKSQLSI